MSEIKYLGTEGLSTLIGKIKQSISESNAPLLINELHGLEFSNLDGSLNTSYCIIDERKYNSIIDKINRSYNESKRLLLQSEKIGENKAFEAQVEAFVKDNNELSFYLTVSSNNISKAYYFEPYSQSNTDYPNKADNTYCVIVIDYPQLDYDDTELRNDITQLCADTYLPKSGGDVTGKVTIDGESYSNILEITRSSNPGGVGIKYSNSRGTLGTIGFAGSGTPIVTSPDGKTDYKIWTENNDGLDSGLDADLLDGVQGTDYFKTKTLEPQDLDANGLTEFNTLYTNKSDVNQSWQGKTFTNFPIDITTGGFSLRTIREASRLKQIFTYYSTNDIWIRRLYYSNNKHVWSSWVKVALVSDNVASADKLTTKQLTNEDLNSITETLSTYYADSINSCTNIPSGKTGVAFNLICSRRNNTDYANQIWLGSDGSIFIRVKSKSWADWKRMLTEDDLPKTWIGTESEYNALTTKDANTIYYIKE